MSKHIYTNTSKQGGARQQAEREASALTKLIDTWYALHIGPFPDGALHGNPDRHAHAGCRSCQGLRHYSKGEVFIQDYLLDQAGSVSVGGGLRLSRERLRDVLEMPDKAKISAFEKAFVEYRTSGPMGNPASSPFVTIENGKVVILQDELEAHCKSFEKHISNPEDVQLHDDLEQFIALHKSINQRLDKKGLPLITLQQGPSFRNNDVVKKHPDGSLNYYLNKELLASYLR